MATIGLYFNMDPDSLNEMRGRLNELFGRLGYATDIPSRPEAGKRLLPWRGGLSNGLLALDRGELAVVPVPDPGAIADVIRKLRHLADDNETDFFDPCSDPLTQALHAYADALETTLTQADRAGDADV